jgi:hypothetical protein
MPPIPPDPSKLIPPDFLKRLGGSTAFRQLREDGKTSWIPRAGSRREEIAKAVFAPVFSGGQDSNSPAFHLEAAKTLRENRLLDAAFLTLARGLSIQPDNPDLQIAMAEVTYMLVSASGIA